MNCRRAVDRFRVRDLRGHVILCHRYVVSISDGRRMKRIISDIKSDFDQSRSVAFVVASVLRTQTANLREIVR
jgi:hypothetical protein